jgi:hypothetical protein
MTVSRRHWCLCCVEDRDGSDLYNLATELRAFLKSVLPDAEVVRKPDDITHSWELSYPVTEIWEYGSWRRIMLDLILFCLDLRLLPLQ